jgi:hypothetical protein
VHLKTPVFDAISVMWLGASSVPKPSRIMYNDDGKNAVACACGRVVESGLLPRGN